MITFPLDTKSKTPLYQQIYQGIQSYILNGTLAAGTKLPSTRALSANLGVMNLLPLPALDGGRLVFLILELIRGKRINPEKEGMVHFIGLMALMALMVVILFSDVMKLM